MDHLRQQQQQRRKLPNGINPCIITTISIREHTLESSSLLPHCSSPLSVSVAPSCIFTTFTRSSKILLASNGVIWEMEWIHPNEKHHSSYPLPFLPSKNLHRYQVREISNRQFRLVQFVELLAIFVYCLWQSANHWMSPSTVFQCQETESVQTRPARLKRTIRARREASIIDSLSSHVCRKRSYRQIFKTQPLKFLSKGPCLLGSCSQDFSS